VKKSFTAKGARDTKERNSFTAKDAKDAKGIIIRSRATTRSLAGCPDCSFSLASFAAFAVRLLFSLASFASFAVKL
jgi:hypothetical protein